MREADVGLRLREPTQPDLIRRRLFTVRYHAYASTVISSGTASRSRSTTSSATADRLQRRRCQLSDPDAELASGAGQEARPAPSALTVNNMVALKRAVQNGAGIGVLPDYFVEPDSGLVQLLPHADMPELDCYFVYPEELKSVARVQVFRDFLVANAQRWRY